MFSIGAFAIIFDELGQVLLCHRRDMDMWNLPGGGMESGELPTETVIRETREETALEVVVERLIGVYRKKDKDEIVFAFICRVTNGELSTTDEADASRYFPLNAIPENTPPKQVERIIDALQPGAQPVFRVQTGMSSRQWLRTIKNTNP